MATTREQLLRKRYDAEERKVDRMMERYRAKYGRNWTKNDLTPREYQAFLSALRKAKKAIDAIVAIQVNDGRIKKVR